MIKHRNTIKSWTRWKFPIAWPSKTNSLVLLQTVSLTLLEASTKKEIILWKVRTKYLYSRVAMHQKKKKRTREFFYAFQLVNKSCSSNLHDTMFLFHTSLRFTPWNTGRATVEIHLSSNQRHEQEYRLHSVNLSVYEIKSHSKKTLPMKKAKKSEVALKHRSDSNSSGFSCFTFAF